jgi:hypothetical protein
MHRYHVVWKYKILYGIGLFAKHMSVLYKNLVCMDAPITHGPTSQQKDHPLTDEIESMLQMIIEKTYDQQANKMTTSL